MTAEEPCSEVLINFAFRLTEEEAQQCLELMDSPKSGYAKKLNELILTLLAALFLILYLLRPQMISYMLLSIALTATLFAVHYLPGRNRKKRAVKLARQSGEYRFSLLRDGRIITDGLQEVSHFKKGFRSYESSLVYLLIVDGCRYCIPKREIPDGKVNEFKALLLNSEL